MRQGSYAHIRPTGGVSSRRTAIQTNLMTLIDDLRLRMPLRRNRRQYEQLTDFEGAVKGLKQDGRIEIGPLGSDMVVARCWQQWITASRRVRNQEKMIARIVQSEEWPLWHQQLASIQCQPPSRHPVP
ncbi:hypothetical protein TNCV_4805491 [Trichonephila clavipes]|nr:hypothetical protein TNCV_4805491 [Trichonephila clavipes]